MALYLYILIAIKHQYNEEIISFAFILFIFPMLSAFHHISVSCIINFVRRRKSYN